jgi:hypothetical protein
MDGIINFSEFFKNKKELPKFDKQDILNDLFIEDDQLVESDREESSTQGIIVDEPISKDSYDLTKEEIDNLIHKELQRIKKQTQDEYKVNENQVVDLPLESEVEEEEEEIDEEPEKISESNEDFYKLYNDKSETFSCEIELEGANLKDTQVRLVVESDNWNLMFPGEIDRYGKVTIPIKKLSLFDEGTTGKIKMEVIAEGTVFVPWEDDFEVKMSKKVMVKFNESKSNKPKLPQKPAVKVNFRK